MRFLRYAALVLAAVLLSAFLFQRSYLMALARKSVGGDEPCPWGTLARFPWTTSRLTALQAQYEASIRPLESDAALGIQRFASPTRPFWIKQDGRMMNGKSLLAYVLAEEDWIREQAAQYHVRPGDVVVDVGAHVGTFGDDALRRGASRVIMVEPDPVNVECIRRNFRDEIASGRVNVVPEGAWSGPGSLEFNIGVANSGTGSLTIAEPGARKIQVKVRPLDEMLRELGASKVDFIKMDIEGAEREALKGAMHTLRTSRPRLMLDSYHLPDDAVVLPALVAGAGAGYREFCAVCSTARDAADSRIIPYAIFFHAR